MDRTGLFYCLAPDTAIAQRQVEGSKKRKTIVKVTLMCNADGSDKRNPLIIGHVKKPRCFQKKTWVNSAPTAAATLWRGWMVSYSNISCTISKRHARSKTKHRSPPDKASAHTAHDMEDKERESRVPSYKNDFKAAKNGRRYYLLI